MLTIAWDSIDQIRANDELGTAIIELIMVVATLSVILVLVTNKKRYPKLTAKGFNGMIGGFMLFALHIVFDFLDTLTTKKVGGETTAFYTLMDRMDAIFAFIGLFVIGFAFLNIAKYGMKLWEAQP